MLERKEGLSQISAIKFKVTWKDLSVGNSTNLESRQIGAEILGTS